MCFAQPQILVHVFVIMGIYFLDFIFFLIFLWFERFYPRRRVHAEIDFFILFVYLLLVVDNKSIKKIRFNFKIDSKKQIFIK